MLIASSQKPEARIQQPAASNIQTALPHGEGGGGGPGSEDSIRSQHQLLTTTRSQEEK